MHVMAKSGVLNRTACVCADNMMQHPAKKHCCSQSHVALPLFCCRSFAAALLLLLSCCHTHAAAVFVGTLHARPQELPQCRPHSQGGTYVSSPRPERNRIFSWNSSSVSSNLCRKQHMY